MKRDRVQGRVACYRSLETFADARRMSAQLFRWRSVMSRMLPLVFGYVDAAWDRGRKIMEVTLPLHSGDRRSGSRRRAQFAAVALGCSMALWTPMASAQEIPEQPATQTSLVEVGGTTFVIHHYEIEGASSFTPPEGVTEVDVLIIGGGGGGGAATGFGNAGAGGGGAGGVIERFGVSVGTDPIPIVVGVRGTAGSGGNVSGSNGGNSSFGDLIALGGGGGAGGNVQGNSGGSGGGSRGSPAPGGEALQPGTASGGFGHRGGNAPNSPAGAGGTGGGGAGGPGGDGSGNPFAATAGGPGIASNMTGFSVNYAGGGGGGGARNNAFGAGQDGGGDGGNNGRAPVPGQANTGGGGGGGNNNRAGAAGGSGLVIVRYDAALLPATEVEPEPEPEPPLPEVEDPPVSEVAIAQTPLFLSQAINPQVMLTLSNDHQLFFPAYDDYSDITGNGLADTTYIHDHEYYGYFDPQKCYSYNTTNNRFVPQAVSPNRYCDAVAGEWSGNFLNWVSMARVDTVRKLLYGGTRSVDTATLTVLERSHIPTDAHSWAKYYNGSDIHRLTPFSGLVTGLNTQESGITFCNTTRPASFVASQNATDPPLIRVARGNYLLWTSNERWQCKWREERSGMLSGFGQAGSNGNDPAISGIPASAENPRRTGTLAVSLGNGLREGEFVARVEACVEGLEGTERCKRYPGGNLKPVGILQLFGDEDLIDFGLISGSYGRNKSGGVLRKNIGTFRDEVRANTDGTFRPQPSTGGIVGTIDRFRIFGYRHQSNGTYFGNTGGGSDSCDFGRSSFDDGRCVSWGNPQTEMFLESLRYFGGHSPTPEYVSDDSGFISGLITADWQDPLSNANHCAPLNIIQFNASSSSYDGDQLAGAIDIGLSSVTAATNAVGQGEGIHGAQWFIGSTPENANELCTAKEINALGQVEGTCPDAPRLEGSFNVAGLAHHAWTQGIRDDLFGDQFVRTYGVSLAPAVPTVRIPIPGSDRSVTLLPACRNTSVTPNGNCALVDFKIVEQDFDKGTGRFYVNWEDIEQGGDYDSDLWGVISYEIEGGSVLRITTQAVATSTGQSLGFGYVISGTDNGDGFRVHSGSQGFTFEDPNGFPDCSGGCGLGDGPSTAEYFVGGTAGTEAGLLEQPLFYAAKWGGFDKSDGDSDPTRDTSLWDTTGDGLPDNFFFAVDPGELEAGLESAFLTVLVTSASAASVATNSTRLDADAAIYQARFNSDRWSGQLLAFGIEPNGDVNPEPLWDAATRLDAADPIFRNIISSKGLDFSDASDAGAVTTTGIPFQWDDLSPEQQTQLQQGLDAAQIAAGLDVQRLLYLRGKRDLEQTPQNQAAPFRARDSALGDIVNSNPQFVGTQDFGYGRLGIDDDFPEGTGEAYRTYLTANIERVPLVVVGANDGMLHAFDARVDEDNLANGGKELFAYVPSGVYENLHELTRPDYAHRYYVDGTPRVADAWLGGTLGWRKVVAGTTGAGGRTVYMLDVSNPDSMSSADVLWEFRHKDLGVTIGQPSIVPLPTIGRFGVVFSSGYNNGGEGHVFVVDAETGALIKKFTTGIETAGMGSPLVIDAGGDSIADRIYVGDLEGRLWRFDLSGNNVGQWGMPNFLTQGPNRFPLFRARGPNGEFQPISAQPEAGRNKNGNIMLFFGTGTFFLNGDNVVPEDPDVQTFYGVIDRNQRIDDRGNMTRQEILAEVVDFDLNLRVVSEKELSTPSDGWYLDLAFSESRGGPGPIGERVTQRAILRAGRIIFTTIIPSENACDFGGLSFLMELDAFTGARIERPVFDLDGDGLFDDADKVTVMIDGEEVRVSPSGQMPEGVGLLSQPTILSAGDREFKFLSGSTGAIQGVTERGADGFGRQSWRELR